MVCPYNRCHPCGLAHPRQAEAASTAETMNSLSVAYRRTPTSFEALMHTIANVRFLALGAILAAACLQADAAGGRWLRGARSPASTGTPRNQAPYRPGASPYETAHGTRPKYFVPPTNPRTPTWKMYGTPPGVVPGDWPSYAPLGFGGYRFPASGAQAYR